MLGRQIRIIAEKYGIILIYLFGSEAKKGRIYSEGGRIKPHPFSDLDVAVAFEKEPQEPMETYSCLYREFSELFSPFQVDLLFIQEVNPLFQLEIIKGIRIYAKEERIADEFEESIMKKSEDLLFKKRVLDREIMEAVENGYIEFEYSPNP